MDCHSRMRLFYSIYDYMLSFQDLWVQSLEVEEEEAATGAKGQVQLAEVVGGRLRSKGCAKTVRRMQLLSSVLTVSHHWFFVITVLLFYTEG